MKSREKWLLSPAPTAANISFTFSEVLSSSSLALNSRLDFIHRVVAWGLKYRIWKALNVLEGKVIGSCYPRHRNLEFRRFLRQIDREPPGELAIHLILDNYGTHTHPNVKAWLDKHPRFHCHFTPTSSSWLNLVERWFGELTRKRIRRGVFKSIAELVAAIEEFIRVNNTSPKPFVWTKKVEAILDKVARCKAVAVTLH